MKKLLLTLLTMLMLTGSAWAEWVKVSESLDDEQVGYIDPGTIRKNGNLVRVWEIHDYKSRQKKVFGELSTRFRALYDCRQERVQILSLSSHSGPMARGSTLFQTLTGDGTWLDIPPASMSEDTLKIVCAK